MAKKTFVSITGFKQTGEQITKFLNAQIKDQSLVKSIASQAVDQIRNRTRGRLEDYKQKDLKPSTVERRKGLIAAGNELDSTLTKPKQSNLTLSGQLLDAIHYKLNAAVSSFTIILLEGRFPYTGLRGKQLENKTNKKIKNELEDNGRKFFFISAALKAQLEDKIRQALRQKLSLYRKLTGK